MLKRFKKVFTGLTFKTVTKRKGFLYLYAGDIPSRPEYSEKGAVGLSLSTQDCRHIQHDKGGSKSGAVIRNARQPRSLPFIFAATARCRALRFALY